MAKSLENIPYSEFSTKASLPLHIRGLYCGIAHGQSAPTIAGNRVFYNDNMVGAKNKVVKSRLQFRMKMSKKECPSSEEK
jgi:hypothetical protein